MLDQAQSAAQAELLALSNQEAAAEVDKAEQPHGKRQQIPFAFAKRHGVLITEIHNGTAKVLCRPGVSSTVFAELRRYLGLPVQLAMISPDDFDATLQAMRKDFKFMGPTGVYYFLYVVGEPVPPHEEFEATYRK